MRTSIIAAILACIAATAAASPHHVATQLDVISPGHARLTVIVTTQRGDPDQVVATIALPIGMTPTAMTLEHDGMQPSVASDMEVVAARDDFDETVRVLRDPALLEYLSERTARLSVFPVQRDDPAKVVIELTATSLVRVRALPALAADRSLLAQEPGALARPPSADPIGDQYADYWPAHHE